MLGMREILRDRRGIKDEVKSLNLSRKKVKKFLFSDILKHSVAYCCWVCGGRGIKNTSIYLIALHSF